MWFIEPKRAESMNFVDTILRQCKLNYGTAQVDNIRQTLLDAQNLRNHFCSSQNGDAAESTLIALRRYLYICTSLGTRFVFGSGKGMVNIKYRWTDTWKKQDKFVSGSLIFERACVLYNIAVITANVAFSKTPDPSNIKAIVKDLQQAMSILSYLRDSILPELPTDICEDLSPTSMSLIIDLITCRAQDLMYKKAAADNLNTSLLAKLAKQTALSYCKIRDSSLKSGNTIIGMLIKPLRVRELAYLAITHYQMYLVENPAVYEKANGYGKLLARLRRAGSATTESKSLNDTLNDRQKMVELDPLHAIIMEALQQLERDNRNVYLEPVPDLSSLPDIDAVNTIRVPSISIEEIWEISIGAKDAFDHLVPSNAQHKVDEFKTICSQLLKSLDDAVHFLKENGPPNGGHSFVGKTKIEVAEILWNNIQELKAPTSPLPIQIQDMPTNVQRLESMSTEAQHIVILIKSMIAPPQAPNNMASAPLYTEAYSNYREAENWGAAIYLSRLSGLEAKLQAANGANASIKSNFDKYSKFIQYFNFSKAELEAAVPDNLASSPNIQLLELTEQFNTKLKATEEEYQSFIRAIETSDIISKIMEGHLKGESYDAIISRSLTPIKATHQKIHQQVESIRPLANSLRVLAMQEASQQANSAQEQFARELLAGIPQLQIICQQIDEGYRFFSKVMEMLKTLRDEIGTWLNAKSNVSY